MYFLNIIEKEFNSVSKDVLITSIHEVVPYSYKENKNIFFPFRISCINFEYDKGVIRLNPFPAFYLNDRDNELNLKMGYNEKLFKPYYRYIIPYLFIKYYNIFISNLGSFPMLNEIFFDRSIKKSELDTNIKIFVPFVIYLEDVLYTIYGK